jgi:hypothetical protein
MPANNKISLAFLFFPLLIISLSFGNLMSYFDKIKPAKSVDNVLGIQTEANNSDLDITFWQDFLADNPEYFPGWIELLKIGIERGDKNLIQVSTYHATSLEPNSAILKYYLNALSTK